MANEPGHPGSPGSFLEVPQPPKPKLPKRKIPNETSQAKIPSDCNSGFKKIR